MKKKPRKQKVKFWSKRDQDVMKQVDMSGPPWVLSWASSSPSSLQVQSQKNMFINSWQNVDIWPPNFISKLWHNKKCLEPAWTTDQMLGRDDYQYFTVQEVP